MVFFKDRLVLAYLGEERWKKMVAKQAIGEIGHEFAGIIGVAASTPIEERLKLKLKQDPSQTLVLNAEEEAQLTDALLKADAKKNYAIHYDQIEKVEVRKSGVCCL